MTLRPCSRCNRHYGDEAQCPHCGSTDWRPPAVPEALHDPDLRALAPKYGAPPLVRFGMFAFIAALFAALAALARWLARQ